jgi:hypothetical protein
MPCYSTSTFSTPIDFQFEWIDAPWVKWARKGVPEAFVAGLEVSVTLPVAQRQVDLSLDATGWCMGQLPSVAGLYRSITPTTKTY